MEKIKETKYLALKRKLMKFYICEVKLFNRILGVK